MPLIMMRMSPKEMRPGCSAKILLYGQKELYKLVADVNYYRHFLPFCHTSKVLNASRPNWKSNPGDGPVDLEGELRMGFLGLEESYVLKLDEVKTQ